MVELRTICSITSGQGAPQDNNEYVNGLHTFIKASDLDTIIKDDSEVNSTKITEQAIKKHNYKIFPKNTIIFAKSGQSCKKNRVYLTKEKSCIVNHLCCLYDIDKKYDPKWLKLFIKSFNVTKLIRDDSYPSIALKDISCIQVPEIEITKQREIVVLIDAMNRLLSNKKEQLKQLDEVVKSRFIEMFGDLLYDNKSQVSLKNCTKFIDYRGKTPEKCSMGIRLITAKNVRMHNLNFEPAEFIPEENFDKIMTRGFPKSGDILFTTEAPLGYVCVIPEMKEKFCVGQRLITIVPDERINSIYLEYFMSSEYFQDKIWRNSSGSTVKGIKSRFLEKLFVSIAEKSKQNTFAEFVKQVDKSKFVNPLSQEFFMRNFYVFIIYHCITKGCINFCMPK